MFLLFERKMGTGMGIVSFLMMGIRRGIKLWGLSGFKLDLGLLEGDDHFTGLGCRLITKAFDGIFQFPFHLNFFIFLCVNSLCLYVYIYKVK